MIGHLKKRLKNETFHSEKFKRFIMFSDNNLPFSFTIMNTYRLKFCAINISEFHLEIAVKSDRLKRWTMEIFTWHWKVLFQMNRVYDFVV